MAGAGLRRKSHASRLDTDKIEALAADRAALWERVTKAPFLTVNEKRSPRVTARLKAEMCSNSPTRNKHWAPAVLLRKPRREGRRRMEL